MDNEDAPYRSYNKLTENMSDTQKILNKLDVITDTLATLHNDLTFSMHRLDVVKKHFNIFTLTPKKAAEFNEANSSEHVMNTDTIYESEVDVSDSKVTENEKQII